MLQDSTPQSTAQLLYQVHMMSHTCITCPLSFLDWVHVTSFSQLSCLPSPLLSQLGSLSSPLSSYLVLGACYVIQLLDLLPSGVQYCVHLCKPFSVYHACSCFLLDKKENSVHMDIYMCISMYIILF